MIPNHKYNNCEKCGVKRRTKSLKRVNGIFLCNVCRNREIVLIPRYPGKIPKYVLPKKRVVREKVRATLPKIKPIKKTKRVGTKGLYLSKNEKYFLFKKYQKKGLENEDARLKVEKVCLTMDQLINKLKKEKKTKEEMQKRFVEELEKYTRKIT